MRQRLADPNFKSDMVDAKALRTLKPGTWVNDEIINFYVDALRARADKEGKNIAVGNSFFYSKLSGQGYGGVKRWGRTVCDQLLHETDKASARFPRRTSS